jgi:hypothetical protein
MNAAPNSRLQPDVARCVSASRVPYHFASRATRLKRRSVRRTNHMLKALRRWLNGPSSASLHDVDPSAAAGRPRCSLCGRELENAPDELSLDCGGDCWGCVGEIEADMGYEPSLLRVREESARGLRPGWVERANGQRES